MLHRLDILGGKETIFVLVTHIFNLDIVQRAPLLGNIQGIAGIFSVDMHLDYILNHSNNHRIAQVLQGLADSFFIYTGTLNNKFGAVGKF